jgi:hypothetical protein
MSAPLPVARVPRPQMPAQYDPALIEAAFQALERDLVRRFTREADLALEPGKRLVLAGSGGNTQYALGLSNDGGLTVTNYLTGAEGELIVDWAQVDGAAARDLQIAALEAVADGLSDTYATVTALASVESSLEGSIASLSSGVSASFSATNANVSTNASAIATVQGAAAYYSVEVAAAGSDPALVTLRAGASGSEIGLISRIIRLKNIVGSATVEVMRAVGGLVFFSNPISMDFAGRRLTLGPGFGVSGQEVIFWFGPDTTAPSAQSRTNGYFAFGSNGTPYFGTSALAWGATAAESAASNALVPVGQNRLRYSRGERVTGYWTYFSNGSSASFAAFTFGGFTGLKIDGSFSAAGQVFSIFRSDRFAVTAGEKLGVSAIVEATNCGSGAIRVHFRNSSDGSISSADAGAWSGTSLLSDGRRGGVMTAPANATQAYAEIFMFSAGSGAGSLACCDVMIAGIPASTTAVPVWNPGQDSDALADVTRDSPILQYITSAGRIVDYRALPTNASQGQARVSSTGAFSFPTNRDEISINAATLTFAGGTVSLPSATISGLANSTKYYVFRDVTDATYIATDNFTTATSYIADVTGRYIYLGFYTTRPATGAGGGGGGTGGVEP